jgi:ribosomal protein L6P/L9E
MKKDNLEDYYDFFMELPPTDYLKDIEIQDDYDKPNDFSVRGLSDEQVSQIAIDSLRNAKRSKLKDKIQTKHSGQSSQI